MRTLVTYLALFCGLFCLGAQAANLKVSLAPSQAATAGAQWRVDGGAWRTSGTTVKGLSNGSHLVEFKAVAGWTNPAPRSVNLSGGGTTSLTANYVLAASLRITLSPATAQWRINGGGWLTSGANATNLAAGSYQIDYSAQTGYSAPESETVTLAPGQALALNRNYVQQARVQFTLVPAEGQWRIDGGSWQTSGASVYAVAGNHLIEYAPLPFHDSPAAETVSLTAGEIFTASRTYVSQLPSLAVELNPATGLWRIDGGLWQASGARLTGLDTGDHTLEFSDIGGDHSPLPAEIVSLALRQNARLTRAYSLKPASLTVTLDPANARWRIHPAGSPAPETWNASGASMPDLAAGSYSVDYEMIEGHITPAAESLTLAPGQNAALSRVYIALARLQVSLVPDQAQWRVDGGAWQPSGSSLFIPAGEHLVEYSNMALHDSPTAETITLDAGALSTLSRVYLSQLPTLQVTLSPASGQWRVDGGSWQSSGATLIDLGTGDHTLEFSDLGGDHAPLPAESVSLALRDKLVVARAYSLKPGSLTIDLTPDSARWRVHPQGGTPPGAWNIDGATIANLEPGLYSVEYEELAGYDPLDAETITLAPGQDLALTRDYIATEPAFRVIHAFTNAGQGAIMLRDGEGSLYVGMATGGANGSGQIFRLPLDGSAYELVKSFGNHPDDGRGLTSLIEASDGLLYGTTQNGGAGTNNGTLFRLNKDGSGYAVLRSFATLAQGSAPNSLVEGSDGLLYGTTNQGGGSSGAGVVFKIAKDGSGFAVLRALSSSLDGSRPRGLVEGVDGALYGIANGGGQSNGGTVFKLQRDGSGFTRLKSLGGADGSAPAASLLQASDGLLYGTTTAGGAAGRGVVFRLASDGSGFAVLRSFAGDAVDGGRAEAAVVEGPDGMLYGSTMFAGPGMHGTVFRMNKNGSGYQLLWSFTGATTDGGWPKGLLVAQDGTLFGTNGYKGGDASGILFRMGTDGSGFSKLLDLGSPDGSLPMAPVTEGSDGALYGTTAAGGGLANGTIYRVEKGGSGFSVLHRFTGGAAGAQPMGTRLIEAGDGALYGVAPGGPMSYGTLFRIGKDGTGFTILNNFTNPSAGGYPNDVIEAQDGFLYGTTQSGGASMAGTIFRVAKDGTGLTALRSFSGGALDGSTPYAGLIEGPGGMLYGTTTAGGSAGFGVAFKLSKDGSGYQVLHHFSGGTGDGATPYAPLLLGGDGRLYGTTTTGGSAACGTVYALNTDGSGYAVIKHFQGGYADGASPYYTGLVEQDGRLWGTTNQGGAFLGGTVYRLSHDGSGFEIRANLGLDIHDGRVPATGLTVGTDGRLYGTSAYGGKGGTVFRIRPE